VKENRVDLQPQESPPANQAPNPLLLSLIVPTRNERGNVRELLSRLRDVLDDVESEILIVDDSDDGTPEEAQRAAAELGVNVRVIHREGADRKGGLSTAVIAGIKASQGEYICVMDADLQHPPHLVVEMLKVAREKKADIVAASRYVKGGSDGGLSSSSRRLLSQASKWLVTVLFFPRLRHVTDPLTGYFVARRAVLEGVVLQPIGFKILLEILVRSKWKRSVDVPMKFEQRLAGESKATIRQGTTFLRHAFTLFWETRVRTLVPGGKRR
jgi:dolichol-phosphate mannosyltransferase